MRIVGGKFRHRNILMTNLETTRETQDKVRQAIFTSIGPYFDGGVCLDLFAGSGAMGIEAYSRGMEKIYLNDLNNKALDVCKQNCKSLGITDCSFSNLDYIEFLNTTKAKFDLVILDPPYKMDNIEEILSYTLKTLNNNATVIFEMANESNYPIEIGDLKFVKEKKYGIKKVVFYNKVGDSNE